MTTNGLEFDPGFAPYIMAFSGSVEYIYMDINKFKNLSQKKIKFMQYHKKILELFYNNIGFYIGCLLWAAYIKSQPEQKLLSNHCYGKEFTEEENTAETSFMLRFTELFPKDMKYFLNQNFKFEENIIELIKTYEDFLKINNGFSKSEKNTDVLLPENINLDNCENYKNIIDETLKTQDLSKFIDYLPTLIQR